jgi:cob(I)alamin adenosyltransferase
MQMKIYTGGGDRGKTSLFSGERVTKGHERIEAYGDVDELSSFLGAFAAGLPETQRALGREIQQIQSDLFHLGAWLATTAESPSLELIQAIGEEQIGFLEKAIDRMDEALPELKGFILPGGHKTAVWAHLSRTVCRRAERHVVRFCEQSEGGAGLENILVYLNRLSDYLFVLARHCNRIFGIADVLWKK